MSRNDRRNRPAPPSTPDLSQVPTAEEEPFFVEIDDNPPGRQKTKDAEPPAWFRGPANGQRNSASRPARNRSRPPAPPKRPKKSGQKRVPIVADSEDDEPENELTWQERFKEWILGEGGAGYGVSVLVHIVLLAAMSLWMLSQPSEEELITTVEQSEPVDVASIQNIETEVDLKPEIPEQVNKPEIDPAPMSMPDIGVGSLASSLVDTAGGGIDDIIPKQAITKGSFTVWTEPEDPMPGERYKIMIRVKLKTNAKRIRRSDIKGSVVGTDGYSDHFGGPTEAGYYTVRDKRVQFHVVVPGAVELVKDVIKVESKMLDEKQRIEIVF